MSLMTKPKHTTDKVPAPPEAPDVRRRLHIPPTQWVALALLLLLIGLAATRVLQRRDTSARTSQDGLDVTVTWPERARYREDVQIMVRIENTSGAAFDTVRVTFPHELIGNTADLQFLPEASGAHEVTITDLAAGETHETEAEFRPSYYGRRAGDLIIDAAARRVTIRLSTFILP
jgi:hypothetical protein